MKKHTLEAGSTVYYIAPMGFNEVTANPEQGAYFFTNFDDARDSLSEYRPYHGNRIIGYKLKEAVTLPRVQTHEEMQQVQEKYGLDIDPDMPEQIQKMHIEKATRRGFKGWYIPAEDGFEAGVLLSDTSNLICQGHVLTNRPAARSRPKS